jgi:autotransporter-associated beta strand protein
VASVVFQNNSSAANANFSVNSGGSLGFSNTASAANSTITDNGGVISFADDSNTGNVANLPIAGGGRIQFSGNSSAGTTTLMATGGSSIVISGNATTDKAGIQIFGSSVLDVSAHVTPAVISSIAGDGTIRLGSSALSVSADNDTTFSGHIQDTSPGGSIIKDGTGTLTLTNSNNYRGPTLVNFGTLHASVDLPFGAPADTDYGAYVSIGNNGTLTLDSGATNNYIANSASLFLGNGATVNLNFTGNPDRLRSLSINGVTLPPGIYGSVASGAPNQLPQLNGPGKITATIKAVSRKIQGAAGAFDIDLPLAGPPGIECRLGGASHDYRVVVTFFDNVTYSFVSVPSNTALVSNSSGNGTNTVTIDLTSVVNAQTTQIIIHNLNDGTSMFDVYIPMTVLTADVNASKVVNASDVIQVKAQVGQPVTASNFRSDINCNGTITSSDVIQPKLTSGTFVP